MKGEESVKTTDRNIENSSSSLYQLYVENLWVVKDSTDYLANGHRIFYFYMFFSTFPLPFPCQKHEICRTSG